jgi:hypothetical protein
MRNHAGTIGWCSLKTHRPRGFAPVMPVVGQCGNGEERKMTPTDFWQPFEEVVSSYDELVRVIDTVFKKWSSRSKVFAWRGQVNADWPLYSSLYRRLALTQPRSLPQESNLYRQEDQILINVHRWGLHVSPTGGRFSALRQLATLQHYGAPTRLIDVTFNPWIAAWFAVEKKWDNGTEVHATSDSRLFAVDVTGRLINENATYRPWEDDLTRPWPRKPARSTSSTTKQEYQIWCSQVFGWRPPHFDTRIAAQNGGFIFGGVPTTNGPNGQNQWPKGATTGFWRIEEVRSATSIAIRPHKLNTVHGGVSQDALYTFRIAASAKTAIRERLEKYFGYTHSTIYPDYTGFSLFGTPELKTRS